MSLCIWRQYAPSRTRSLYVARSLIWLICNTTEYLLGNLKLLELVTEKPGRENDRMGCGGYPAPQVG